MAREGTLDDAALEWRIRELEAGQYALEASSGGTATGVNAPANPSASPNAQVGGTPPVPSGLTLVSSVGAITVEWNVVQIQDLLYYEIQVSKDPSFTSGVKTYQQGDNRFIYTEAIGTDTYYLRVRAVNLSRNPGDWTAEINGTTGKVGTADLEDEAVNSFATYTKSSGFTVLGVWTDGSGGGSDGDNETYGPMVVEIPEDSPDAVVNPSIRFEMDYGSAYGGNYNNFYLEFLRRPVGGGSDTVVDSATIDVFSQIPAGGSFIKAGGVLDVFATQDQPGAGQWEYRVKVTVNFDPLNNRLGFQGTNLVMEATVIKK